MWIPGLFLGAVAIVVGAMSIRYADRLARWFERSSAPGRYTAASMKAPGAMAVGIGVAVLLLSVFGRPIP